MRAFRQRVAPSASASAGVGLLTGHRTHTTVCLGRLRRPDRFAFCLENGPCSMCASKNAATDRPPTAASRRIQFAAVLRRSSCRRHPRAKGHIRDRTAGKNAGSDHRGQTRSLLVGPTTTSIGRKSCNARRLAFESLRVGHDAIVAVELAAGWLGVDMATVITAAARHSFRVGAQIYYHPVDRDRTAACSHHRRNRSRADDQNP